MRVRRERGSAPSLSLVLISSGAVYGQGVTGRIQGTVQDQSQATVPGATVTATNQETGYRAEVPTGQGGDYVVPNMPPGKYTVTVTAAGFKWPCPRTSWSSWMA